MQTSIFSKLPIYFAAGIVGLLTLFQGGFYPEHTFIAGILSIAACVLCLAASKQARDTLYLPIYALLLVGVSACMLVGTFANSLSAFSLGEVASWLSVAAFALLCSLIVNDNRASLYDVLGWVGVGSAALALLMASGVIPYTGSLNVGRVQYSFQYANTAALWFLVVFVAASFSANKFLRICAFFPLATLFLTQSMGTLILFVFAMVALLVYWFKNQSVGKAFAFLLQLFCAAACVAPVLYFGITKNPWIAVVAPVVGFCLLMLLRNTLGILLEKRLISNPKASFVGMFCLVALVLCALVVAFAFSGRLPQAFQNFLERLVQMNDAWAMLLTSPLIGVGPDGWVCFYQEIQTAQYVANFVHNSYFQLALDSGLLGLILFVALLALGIFWAFKAKDAVALICIGLICAHAFIDFDFSFSTILMLLVLFLHQGKRFTIKPVVTFTINALLALLMLVGLGVGVSVLQQKNVVIANLGVGNVSPAAKVIESNPLLVNDHEVQSDYIFALCKAGKTQEALSFYDSLRAQTTKECVLLASALYLEGKDQEAQRVLFDMMAKQPKSIELYDSCKILLEQYKASPEAWAEYDRLCEIANAKTGGITALLEDQVTFK